MTTDLGWPGAVGVPENADRDGEHFLHFLHARAIGGPPECVLWVANTRRWSWHGMHITPPSMASWRDAPAYLGPAYPDCPTMDGTDMAHPAWWRGQEYGHAVICAEITRLLDGDPITGVCGEPWETVRRRVAALVAGKGDGDGTLLPGSDAPSRKKAANGGVFQAGPLGETGGAR